MVVGVKQECQVCGNEFTSCVKGGRCVECDVEWGITKEAWAQAVQQMPPPLDKTSEQEIRTARDEGSCARPLAVDVLQKCGVVDQKEWPMDGDRPLTFQQIQAEIGRWSTENFGNNVSKDETSVNFGHPLGSLPSLLGMQEELGELARAVARRHQGRGYEDPKDHRNAKEDALSDLLVFMCDYATREGINLMVVLNRVWQKVKLRRQESWAADKAREEAEAEAAKRTKKADAEAAGRKVAEMVEKALIGQQTEIKFGGETVTGGMARKEKDPDGTPRTVFEWDPPGPTPPPMQPPGPPKVLGKEIASRPCLQCKGTGKVVFSVDDGPVTCEACKGDGFTVTESTEPIDYDNHGFGHAPDAPA